MKKEIDLSKQEILDKFDKVKKGKVSISIIFFIFFKKNHIFSKKSTFFSKKSIFFQKNQYFLKKKPTDRRQ